VSAAPRSSPGRLARLADVVYRRRRVVLAAWVVGLVAAFGATTLAGAWSADYSTPGSESRAAADLLADRFPQQSPETVDVVWQAPAGAAAAAARSRIDRLVARSARLEGVGRSPGTAAAQFSPDGTIGVVRIPLTGLPGEIPKATGEAFIALAEQTAAPGLRVELDGQLIANAQQSDISSEAIGLAIAALVLLITFGSVVAAGLPLATALFGLGISSAVVGLLAAVMKVPDWAPALASMLGIGVGIDYALLIVTRYRAALAHGREPRAALTEAVATGGRSVLIAGTTVVISLLGLFLMGLPYLYGAALSAIAAVLVVMAASITLVPALLALAGRRIDRLHIPGTNRVAADPSSTPAARWARAVQRRPWTAAVAGIAILLVLAAPVTGLRLGFPDRGNDAPDTTTRQAYDLVARGFGSGANGPLLLVADTSRGGAERVGALAAELRAVPGVAAVAKPVVSPRGDAAVLSVTPRTSPQDPATEDLITHLREDVLPHAGVPVSVGGATAAFMDQSQTTSDRLPLFIGGVVGLSFLLLLVAFRSIVVALKAGVMNLLSIGAAYGVVALLAEGGWAGQLIGIDTETPVPPFIPVIMFAVLFGLSMDYEVFLLSRVREEYLAGRDTAGAVTEGLARTARVITAAALIMVAVFGAFALSPEVFLKLIGMGLATAILVDATVVRMVLVPAVMQLLGERNWWLPRWLDRLIPQAALEAPATV
jgi:RND superfamily putative drug exporter